MGETGQEQTGGFSRSEKFLLAKAAGAGIVAFAVTLWLSGVFSDTPVQFWIEVFVACFFSFISAAVVSVMGESVIEDFVKLVMFGVLWWFTRKLAMFDLVTMGMLVGGATAFLGNRFVQRPGKNGRAG